MREMETERAKRQWLVIRKSTQEEKKESTARKEIQRGRRSE